MSSPQIDGAKPESNKTDDMTDWQSPTRKPQGTEQRENKESDNPTIIGFRCSPNAEEERAVFDFLPLVVRQQPLMIPWAINK